MIKMNIIQRVEVEPISQEVLENWILEKIAEQNPAVKVTELKFVQRRDPTRMEVEVTAQIGDAVNTPIIPAEPLKRGAQEELFPQPKPASKTSLIDEVLAEEAAAKSVENVSSVKDIFNM